MCVFRDICIYYIYFYLFFIQINSSCFSFLLARTVSNAPLLDDFWFNLEDTLHARHTALARGEHEGIIPRTRLLPAIWKIM